MCYISGMKWLGTANCVSLGLTALMIMIAARLTSREQLGQYYFVIAVTSVLQILGAFGLPNAATHFVTKLTDGEKHCATNYLLSIRLISSFLLAVVVFCFGYLLCSIIGGETTPLVMYWVPPLLVTILNYQVVIGLAAAYKRFRHMSAAIVLIAAIRVTCSFAMLLRGFGSTALLTAFAVSQVCGYLVLLWALPLSKTIILRMPAIQGLFRFSAWDYAKSVLSVVSYRVADMVTMTLLGPATLAVYSTGQQIPDILMRMFDSTRPAILGYASGTSLSGEKLQRVFKNFFGILSLAALLLILLSREIVPLLYTEKYASSVPIMQLLCVAATLGLTAYFLSLVMLGGGRSDRAFFVVIPQSVVMLFSLIAFIPLYAHVGAAISVVLMQGTGAVAALWFICEERRLFLRLLIPCVMDIVVLIAMMVMSLSMKSDRAFLCVGGVTFVFHIVMKVLDGTIGEVAPMLSPWACRERVIHQ